MAVVGGDWGLLSDLVPTLRIPAFLAPPPTTPVPGDAPAALAAVLGKGRARLLAELEAPAPAERVRG